MNRLEFENNMNYIKEQAIELLNGNFDRHEIDRVLMNIVDMADYKYLELIEEWKKLDKLKIFEIEVVDVRTKEIEFLTFDICVNVPDRQVIAQHVAFNKEQKASALISYESVRIDEKRSLDYHLQALYDECITAIYNSEFYTLRG